MSERFLFPDLKFIKKEVNERFLSLLYSIYADHPTYSYITEEKDSGLLIYPSYADPGYDGKYPRFISKTGSYAYGLMDTFNNNMANEVIRDGVVSGAEYKQFINTSVTILIQANAEEESSDLADELVNIVVFAMRSRFRNQGLIVRGSSVSETDLLNKEQDVFQTNVVFSFDVPWSTFEVDLNDPITITDPELEKDDPLIFETYRSPGAYVVQQKEKPFDE